MTARLRRAPSAWGMATDRGEHWIQRGACRDQDPQWWELTGPSLVLTSGNVAAVILCKSCPVAKQCGEAAKDTGAVSVIQAAKAWLDPKVWPNGIRLTCERCGLVKRRGRAACGECARAEMGRAA